MDQIVIHVGPEGFQRQFGAMRCVGGVHAGSPGCLWGKGNAGSHRTPKRFGTKMSPRSPFYPLLLKGKSQAPAVCSLIFFPALTVYVF